MDSHSNQPSEEQCSNVAGRQLFSDMQLAELCEHHPERAYAIYKADKALWGASKESAGERLQELYKDPVSYMPSSAPVCHFHGAICLIVVFTFCRNTAKSSVGSRRMRRR